MKFKESLAGWLDRRFTSSFMSYRRVFSVALPIFLDQFSFVALGLFNMGMISASGAEAVSAAGMVDTLNYLVSQIYLAAAMGGTVLAAKYSGAQNRSLVSASAVQALLTSFLIASILGLALGLFRGPVLRMLYGAAEPEVIELAKIYLASIAISSPASAVINTANGILRGSGDSKAALFSALMTHISYAILNVIMLSAMKMGIKGLFYSMIVSRTFGSAVSLYFLARRDIFLHLRFRDLFRSDASILKKLYRFGVPFAAENIFFNGGTFAIQVMIVSMGTNAIALNTICNSILGVILSGTESLCNTTVTVIGQCMGINDHALSEKYIRSFIRLGQIVSIIFLVLILLFFPLIMGMFSTSGELSGKAFRIIAFSGVILSIFWPASFVLPAGLRTAGDVRYTSVAVLLSMWTVRVLMSYVLAVVMGLGVEGVWIAMCLDWISRSVIFGFRLKTDKWFAQG